MDDVFKEVNMSIWDVFRVGKIKAELEQMQKERDALKGRIAESEDLMKYHQLKRAFSLMEERKASLAQEIARLDSFFQQKNKH
jgi:predicted  nucleic acid-binding Zn-ribbon protein